MLQESTRIRDKHVSFFLRLEVEEAIFKQEAVFSVLMTFDQEFLIPPGHWTIVSEL
jgi:hypothetical protein